MSKPQPLKARYHLVAEFHKDVDDYALSVYAWYNFAAGYGLIKCYSINNRHTGAIMYDAFPKIPPSDNYLVHVAAEKGNVQATIEWAERLNNNAGKDWGIDE